MELFNEIIAPMGAGSLAKSVVDVVRRQYPNIEAWVVWLVGAALAALLVVASEMASDTPFTQKAVGIMILKAVAAWVFALSQTALHNRATGE